MTDAARIEYCRWITSGKKKGLKDHVIMVLTLVGPLTDHQLTEVISQHRFGTDVRKISSTTSNLFYEGKLNRNETYQPDDRTEMASQYRIPESPVSLVEICQRNIALKQEQLKNAANALAEWEQNLQLELSRLENEENYNKLHGPL